MPSFIHSHFGLATQLQMLQEEILFDTLYPWSSLSSSKPPPTAFTASSVHHSWFLSLDYAPFPDVLPHRTSAIPLNTSLYFFHSSSKPSASSLSCSYLALILSLYSTMTFPPHNLPTPVLNLPPFLHPYHKHYRLVLGSNILFRHCLTFINQPQMSLPYHNQIQLCSMLSTPAGNLVAFNKSSFKIYKNSITNQSWHSSNLSTLIFILQLSRWGKTPLARQMGQDVSTH